MPGAPLLYSAAAVNVEPTMPEFPSKRIFSLAEARGLLPEVQQITEEAYQQVEKLREETGPASQSGDVQGSIEAVVTSWAKALDERGIEVKGLWLADFDNGSGYYCWQYPEPRLDFYHTYEDGFRGRMRIQ